MSTPISLISILVHHRWSQMRRRSIEKSFIAVCVRKSSHLMEGKKKQKVIEKELEIVAAAARIQPDTLRRVGDDRWMQRSKSSTAQ